MSSKKYPAVTHLSNGHNGNGWLGLRRQAEGNTENQKAYVTAIHTSDVTFCEGIAGTGKTFLAVGMAIHTLLENEDKRARNRITKLIISRPIVPAGGEDIGFLPGDLHKKTDPYMAPIYESIRKFCRDDTEYNKVVNQTGTNPILEVCPLAFMRGRTFDNSFVILDEAQNSTKEQMIMFLTRMGKNCKVVVTGDLSQSDLDEENGLAIALLRLEGQQFSKGKVNVCYMDTTDIMRNDLIAEIICAMRDPEALDGDDEPEEPDPDNPNMRNRITPYYTHKQETVDGAIIPTEDNFDPGQ